MASQHKSNVGEMLKTTKENKIWRNMIAKLTPSSIAPHRDDDDHDISCAKASEFLSVGSIMRR